MIFLFILFNFWGGARASETPEFPSCDPASEFILEAPKMTGPKLTQNADFNASLDFCSAWNPEFLNNGNHCCAKFVHSHRRKSNLCAPKRRKGTFCDEMTPEEISYTNAVKTGKLADVLADISAEMGRREQAYCSVNAGFLAHGRRLVPTDANLVAIRSPDRCVDFGTDAMVGMLEWLGRQIKAEYAGPEYSGVRLLVADIAGPRGGCLTGRGGRRGHASHTTGQDADVGFLTAKPGVKSPLELHQHFDSKTEWWMIKKIFKNPFACVRVIFLDRKWIRKLSKDEARDPEWITYRKFLRHLPGHKNHTHIRVGDAPGQPGCGPNARPDLETEFEGDSEEGAAGGGDSDGIELYRDLPAGQPSQLD